MEDLNYKRIENAINYIRANFKEQPSLEEIASTVHMSADHFQRIFKEWAGVSPKKFVQYLSLNYAKSLLKQGDQSILDVTYDTGFSSPSRLHDLFIKIEAMTPGEFKSMGRGQTLNFCFAESPFGTVLVASTHRGVCHMSFVEDKTSGLAELKGRFPNAQFHQITDKFQQDALFIFQKDWRQLDEIRLHLAGTAFQLKVWESLLKIPFGSISTYGKLAKDIRNPKAARAVGSAIGSNPVAFLIPCHRVIRSTGEMGGYMWGENRKFAMLGWEAASREGNLHE